jgi:bifunctional ADP-heptose synthase (sugar kinase/adenylyltransferase)
MTFTKLQFRPGVNRETTSYSNEGGCFDILHVGHIRYLQASKALGTRLAHAYPDHRT